MIVEKEDQDLEIREENQDDHVIIEGHVITKLEMNLNQMMIDGKVKRKDLKEVTTR